MSTEKPYRNYRHKDNGDCTNHLHQEFNQKSPDIVWVSDFTYIKVSGIWYYLCIVMGLFSRKVISWNISAIPDVNLVLTAFKKAYDKRRWPAGLMFHSDRGSQYTAFAFRQLLDSLNVVQSFSKKGYPFVNACCESFFKYLKKEETNQKPITLYRSCIYPYLSTLKVSTTLGDHMVLLDCYPLMKKKNSSGIRLSNWFQKIFSNNRVYLLDYSATDCLIHTFLIDILSYYTFRVHTYILAPKYPILI